MDCCHHFAVLVSKSSDLANLLEATKAGDHAAKYLQNVAKAGVLSQAEKVHDPCSIQSAQGN